MITIRKTRRWESNKNKLFLFLRYNILFNFSIKCINKCGRDWSPLFVRPPTSTRKKTIQGIFIKFSTEFYIASFSVNLIFFVYIVRSLSNLKWWSLKFKILPTVSSPFAFPLKTVYVQPGIASFISYNPSLRGIHFLQWPVSSFFSSLQRHFLFSSLFFWIIC